MSNRRSFLQRAFGMGAGMFAGRSLLAETAHRRGLPFHGANREAYTLRAITTEVGDLPYTVEGGVKVFRLTAQVVRQRIAPNKVIDVWGFNGSAPGPTFQVTEGDRVRVIFENQLPEPCSIHWHGFEDRIGFDGMPGISQEPTRPGQTFVYEFDIHQAGTYFYHSHMAMQEMAGMLGAFLMHPREPYHPHCDKDYVLHFQEYAVLPNNTVPNTANMEFNWLVINGKAAPLATPLLVRQGDRVRLRLINLGMDHHPIHLHGHTFVTTGTEGGRIQPSAWWPGNTALVGVGQARDVEFQANNPGDWMLHCHMPHHMMNQMSSTVLGEARTNGPLSQTESTHAMQNMMSQMQHGRPATSAEQMQGMMSMNMSGEAMAQQALDVAPDAGNVPNFPQDGYMEGPMMNMEHDRMLAISENDGLRAGWSSSMQGMMAFVRVLPPNRYDEILAKIREAGRTFEPYAALLSQDGGRL